MTTVLEQDGEEKDKWPPEKKEWKEEEEEEEGPSYVSSLPMLVLNSKVSRDGRVKSEKRR